MFERFTPKSEKEKGPEQIVRLGVKTLESEVNIEEPRRAGGFMLSTLMAMGLSLGLLAGGAEAQVRGWSPAGGAGKQVAGQILNQGIFEAGSAIDRSQNAKRDKIENDYVANLTELGNVERNLDYEYAVEKSKLNRTGNRQGLENLEKEYRMGKGKLAKDRANLENEYRKKIRSLEMKKSIVQTVLRGARGW